MWTEKGEGVVREDSTLGRGGEKRGREISREISDVHMKRRQQGPVIQVGILPAILQDGI